MNPKLVSHVGVRLLTCCAAIAASLASPAARAADVFPSKPITMIAAFPPGGPADVLARAMQPTMSKLLGQPLIVENLPGAGGALAVKKLLSSPADGYTLIMGSPNEAILAPLSNTAAKYKPEDLFLLAPVSNHPLIVMTRPDLPHASLDQIIEASKKAGTDGLTFGSPGHGTMYHIVSEYLAQATGAQFVHIPYKGASPMMADLAGRQIDFTILPNIGGSIQMIQTNKIKAVNVLDTARMANLPGVPTIMEGKLPNKGDYVHSIWLGLMAKSGIPADRVKVLLDAAQKAIQSPEMVRALELSGAAPLKPQSLGTSAEFYAREIDKFGKMARSIKLKPE
jgi:tripartite-type tricarboxylate transporter receptor subunit TctC